MKQIVEHLPGGRLYKGEDFLAMQQLTLDLTEKFFAQYGDFILYGCEITGGNITPGVIMLDGKACYFEGKENAPTPFYVRKAEITEDVPYKTGNNTGYISYLALPCEPVIGFYWAHFWDLIRFDEAIVRDHYSYQEVRTNQRWVNNKVIYKKTLGFSGSGALVDGCLESPHDIDQLHQLIKVEGIFSADSIKFVSVPNTVIELKCDQSMIYIGPVDATDLRCFITLYYTKL